MIVWRNRRSRRCAPTGQATTFGSWRQAHRPGQLRSAPSLSARVFPVVVVRRRRCASSGAAARSALRPRQPARATGRVVHAHSARTARPARGPRRPGGPSTVGPVTPGGRRARYSSGVRCPLRLRPRARAPPRRPYRRYAEAGHAHAGRVPALRVRSPPRSMTHDVARRREDQTPPRRRIDRERSHDRRPGTRRRLMPRTPCPPRPWRWNEVEPASASRARSALTNSMHRAPVSGRASQLARRRPPATAGVMPRTPAAARPIGRTSGPRRTGSPWPFVRGHERRRPRPVVWMTRTSSSPSGRLIAISPLRMRRVVLRPSSSSSPRRCWVAKNRYAPSS